MKITNKYGLPESLVRAVQNHKHKSADYSASMLTNSPRIVHLTRRHYHELEEDVSERIWALLGTAVHGIIEGHEADNEIAEGYMEIEVLPGVRVSGHSDVYDYDTKTVSDYKVTSAYAIIYGSRDAEWEKQLNVYKLLFEHTGFPVENLRIIAVLRDWSKTKAQRDGSYPQVNVAVLPIRMKPLKDTIAWVRGRVELFEAHKETPDDELPACTAEDRWQSPSKWALMKQGRKSAVKLYDTEQEAVDAITDSKHYIQERPSEPRRCMDYCAVAPFCNQWQSMKHQYGG